MTLHINILNPKATRLLKELEDLKLISIQKEKESNFLNVVGKLRKKATNQAPSIDEITKEVESVRAKRYASKKS